MSRRLLIRYGLQQHAEFIQVQYLRRLPGQAAEQARTTYNTIASQEVGQPGLHH